MGFTRIAWVCGIVAALLASTGVVVDPSTARACGGFFSGKRLGADRRPSLAYEQAVIVHDASKGRQHFIREVAFRKANERFGFVVPVPTRPEVAKVGKGLMKLFQLDFPFDAPPVFDTVGRGSGSGSGSGAGFGGRGVTVLERTKVGSFTAFVLAAQDSLALSKWLKKNGLVTTPETDAWLAHYVALDFYYVAMRYDPPKGDKKVRPTMTSETMRISFDTPVPYYPYLEPAAPAGIVGEERVLDLWVVGTKPVIPVALADRDGKRSWIRPLRAGQVHADASVKLATFGDVLDVPMPEGALVVQTFQDQKRSREGIGDILFVPAEPTTLSDKDRAALQPMLALLDPAIAAGGAVP